MHRTVTAKQNRNVGLLEKGGPFDAGQALEAENSARYTSRPNDGSGAHAQELDHRERSDATASLASSWGVEAEGSIGSSKAMLYQGMAFQSCRKGLLVVQRHD